MLRITSFSTASLSMVLVNMFILCGPSLALELPVFTKDTPVMQPSNSLFRILALCRNNQSIGGKCIDDNTLKLLQNNASKAKYYKDGQKLVFFNKEGARVLTVPVLGYFNSTTIDLGNGNTIEVKIFNRLDFVLI